MPEELKSFLLAVSIILSIALFMPCIESIAKIVRRNSARRIKAELSQLKPAKRLRRSEAA